VGYGDIPAVTTLEKWMSISWMMVGVGFYSYIIGTVSQVLEKMDNRKSTLKAKIDVIEVFCSETNLKPNLKKKILNTLEYNS
jgi:hyperpolarization activated cyclic nucleotide-gated potassium channel 1